MAAPMEFSGSSAATSGDVTAGYNINASTITGGGGFSLSQIPPAAWMVGGIVALIILFKQGRK